MLAAVLVLAVVLILVLVAVAVLILVIILVLIAVLVVVLVIHVQFLRKYLSAVRRRGILPGKSGFILGFKYKTYQKTGCDGGGDATGGCLKTTGEDAKKAHFIHRFFDTFGKAMPKSSQGDGCASSGEIRKMLIKTHATKNHACHYVAYQNSCRGEFCFVNENLPDDAEQSAK